MHWHPTASLETLKQRSEILREIRAFFHSRNIMEVETPVLSRSTIPDPHIHSLQTHLLGKRFYLQTSPEFHMKRLLAKSVGCIFQMSKVFREDDQGSIHNPEFTLLEWYRLEFSLQDLMDEVDDFLQNVGNFLPAKFLTYQNLFLENLNIDPLICSEQELKNLARQREINIIGELSGKDDWLNLLMTHCIEPRMNDDKQPYFIYDFPISQGALAKASNIDSRVAQRFEVYLHGLELANGFLELQDPQEQKHRFNQDIQKRKSMRSKEIPMPNEFIAALEHGLPNCAGVALGIDRLLMILLKKSSIAEVMSFTIDRA